VNLQYPLFLLMLLVTATFLLRRLAQLGGGAVVTGEEYRPVSTRSACIRRRPAPPLWCVNVRPRRRRRQWDFLVALARHGPEHDAAA
jgi:hypothetical protein